MASFASLDKRLSRDVGLIHDYLWQGWKGDPGKLRADLRREARELDAFLGVRGKLRRPANALLDKFDAKHGPSLYEFLYDTYNLTAATEHVRKGDYKGAAEHAAWAVESMSIGVCSAANRFDIVEKWGHGGETDYEQYTSAIADMLQGKGVARAGEYKRMLLVARTFGKQWDRGASKERQAVAARAAIAAAAWCGLTTSSIHGALRASRGFPQTDYAAVITRIVERL